jgi:hypothetical protein
MESAGLKEWAIVCEAMGRGEQSVIVRKGGIAEGRSGFAFRHSEFFLFPTFFHEQVDKVRLDGAEIPKARPGEIEVRFFAKVTASAHIISWETAAALEPLHILQPSVVRERFDYDEAPGLHVALVRVFRLAPSWIFPDAPRYGGCRSWVKLPEIGPAITLEPVLTNRKHEERAGQFRAVCPLRP